jgi:hypothetical protein
VLVCLNQFQIARPVLHHLAALRQIFRAVVGRAQLVALHVRKLPLDDIRAEALLVKNRTLARFVARITGLGERPSSGY